MSSFRFVTGAVLFGLLASTSALADVSFYVAKAGDTPVLGDINLTVAQGDSICLEFYLEVDTAEDVNGYEFDLTSVSGALSGTIAFDCGSVSTNVGHALWGGYGLALQDVSACPPDFRLQAAVLSGPVSLAAFAPSYCGEVCVDTSADATGTFTLSVVTSSGLVNALNEDVAVGSLHTATITVPCSGDDDCDGVGNATDNCPSDANAMQEDIDEDGAGDLCDLCPADPANGCDSDGSTASEVEAAAGGTVQTPDTALTVEIPAGSLAADTTISVTQDSAASNVALQSSVGTAVAVYDFQPDGTTFDPPATLTIVADVSSLTPFERAELAIYELNPETDRFEINPTSSCFVVEDPAGTFTATCTATVDHFSTWGMVTFQQGSIPAVSEWGMFALALALMSLATVLIRSPRVEVSY